MIRKWLSNRLGRGVPEMIVVHHSAGVMDFKGENEHHRKRWNFKSERGYYLGYHYFIERDGTVHKAREHWEMGAHVANQNKGKIGICLQGQGHLYDFTPEQYEKLCLYVSILKWMYQVPVRGHRDLAPTVCPSDFLDNWLKEHNYK